MFDSLREGDDVARLGAEIFRLTAAPHSGQDLRGGSLSFRNRSNPPLQKLQLVSLVGSYSYMGTLRLLRSELNFGSF